MKTELQNPFKWVSIFRITAISVILGIGIYFLPASPIPLWIIIAIAYLLTAIYYIAFKKERWLNTILKTSVVLDTFIITAIIHYTGGTESEFAFLYFFPIATASIFFFLRGGILIAGLSLSVYTAILLLEFYQKISPAFPIQIPIDPYTLYMKLYLQATFFFLISVISGYLAERIRQKGEEVEQVKLDTSTILKSINSGILVIDHYGNILYKNELAQKILGTPIHQNIKELPQEFLNGLTLGTDYHFPITDFPIGFREISVGTKIIGTNASRLKTTRGHSRGFVIVFQDLTNTKITERLATIGRFSGDLAHEIRNPVAALQGSCELIKEGIPQHTQKKLIDNILSQAERLNTILTNFLSFAKPTPIKPQPTEIGQLIKKAIKLATTHNEMKIEVKQNAPLYLNIDPEQMKTAFLNIITNAIQAINGTLHPKISIEVIPPSHKYSIFEEQRTAHKDEAIIIFRDTGQGIPDNEITQIFTPFYTTKKEGTGLGLPIVKKIIDSHNGRIEIKSKVGKGTCFAVHLPLDYKVGNCRV